MPGTDGVAIQPAVEPTGDEPVIVKDYINSFHETDLKQQLDVRTAVDMGYPTTVLEDSGLVDDKVS